MAGPHSCPGWVASLNGGGEVVGKALQEGVEALQEVEKEVLRKVQKEPGQALSGVAEAPTLQPPGLLPPNNIPRRFGEPREPRGRCCSSVCEQEDTCCSGRIRHQRSAETPLAALRAEPFKAQALARADYGAGAYYFFFLLC